MKTNTGISTDRHQERMTEESRSTLQPKRMKEHAEKNFEPPRNVAGRISIRDRPSRVSRTTHDARDSYERSVTPVTLGGGTYSSQLIDCQQKGVIEEPSAYFFRATKLRQIPKDIQIVVISKSCCSGFFSEKVRNDC